MKAGDMAFLAISVGQSLTLIRTVRIADDVRIGSHHRKAIVGAHYSLPTVGGRKGWTRLAELRTGPLPLACRPVPLLRSQP